MQNLGIETVEIRMVNPGRNHKWQVLPKNLMHLESSTKRSRIEVGWVENGGICHIGGRQQKDITDALQCWRAALSVEVANKKTSRVDCCVSYRIKGPAIYG